MKQKLRDENWIETKNVFGNCLLCPEDKRKEIIEALAHSIMTGELLQINQEHSH